MFFSFFISGTLEGLVVLSLASRQQRLQVAGQIDMGSPHLADIRFADGRGHALAGSVGSVGCHCPASSCFCGGWSILPELFRLLLLCHLSQLHTPPLCGCGLPCHRDPSSYLASGPFCLSAAAVFQWQRVWVWKHWQRGRVLQRPWRETQPGCGQQKPIQLSQRGLRIHNHPK